MFQEFDQQMKEKYGDKVFEEDQKTDSEEKIRDFEPKIGGFSLNDIPAGFKLFYVGGFVLLLLGALFVGNFFF